MHGIIMMFVFIIVQDNPISGIHLPWHFSMQDMHEDESPWEPSTQYWLSVQKIHCLNRFTSQVCIASVIKESIFR